MNIRIVRFSKKGESIDGTLYIDGIRICDCAENAETAIPVGTYPVVRHKCKQYARYVPLIQVSPSPPPCESCPKLGFVCNNTTLPCVCPQLKAGNGIHNRLDGSIIVGTRIVPGCMKWIKAPFENICERLRKLDSRGSDITLTIEESPSFNIRHSPLDLQH